MAEITRNTTTNTIGTGDGGLALDPSGTEVVSISNGVLVPDGTKTAPAIRFTDDNNTGIYSPVNDSVSITGQGEDILRLTGVASAVNYVEVNSSVSGADLIIKASGTDTDIDIDLQPKGSGQLLAGGTAVSLSGHQHTTSDISDLSSYTGFDARYYTETEIDGAGYLTSVVAADVDSGAATDGYVLTADGAGGAAWEAVSGGASSIDDLTDVDTSTVAPTDGQVLTWDNTAGQWEPADAAGGGGGEDYFATNATGTLPSATGGAPSLAVGEGCVASGLWSFAAGTGSTASGTKSVVIGAAAEATGAGSIGIGDHVSGTGNYGVAIGYYAYGYAPYSTVMGTLAKADSTCDNATVIGTACASFAYNAKYNTVVGYNNKVETSNRQYCTFVGQNIATTYATADGVVVVGSSGHNVLKLNGSGAFEIEGTNAQIVAPSYASGSEPTGVTGGIIYDSTNNKLKFYNGSTWETITSS